MKVYIVEGQYGAIGAYATLGKAEAAAEKATQDASMGGGFTIYYVKEYEVQE